MSRFTLTLDPELKRVLEQRAEFNRRSIAGEVIYLLECALAAEIEGNQAILRTLMMAQGGVASLTDPRPAAEDTHTAHTATA